MCRKETLHIVLCRIVTGRCRDSSYNVSYEIESESEPKVETTQSRRLDQTVTQKQTKSAHKKNDLTYLVHCRKRKNTHTHRPPVPSQDLDHEVPPKYLKAIIVVGVLSFSRSS